MNDRTAPPTKRPDVVNLVRFPLPPSANALYANFGKRRIKTAVYKQFEQAARFWLLRNSRQIDEARSLTLETGPRKFIHIDTVFFMLRKNIICKDGTPKRNDTSNRLKALHDVLAQILGLDDCWFFSGSYDKVAVDLPKHVGVDITMVVSAYEDRKCESPTW